MDVLSTYLGQCSLQSLSDNMIACCPQYMLLSCVIILKINSKSACHQAGISCATLITMILCSSKRGL